MAFTKGEYEHIEGSTILLIINFMIFFSYAVDSNEVVDFADQYVNYIYSLFYTFTLLHLQNTWFPYIKAAQLAPGSGIFRLLINFP